MSASKKKKSNKKKQKNTNANMNKTQKVIEKELNKVEEKKNQELVENEKNIKPNEIKNISTKDNDNQEQSENVDENKEQEIKTEVTQNKKQEEKEEKKDLIKKENDKPEYVQEMIKKRKERMQIFGLIVTIIILLIIISTVFAIFNMKNSNIVEGVSIKGINVSGIGREEAVYLIGEAMNKELIAEIDLNFGNDYKVTLKPEQIEFQYNIEDAVEKAYNVGRSGNIVENNYKILLTEILGKEVGISYTYNGDLLNKFVEDINSKLPGVLIEPTYYIEDNKLFVHKGTDGIRVKKEELKKQIIQNIFNRNILEIKDGYKQKINIPVENVKASKIDMKKIYSEVYSEPQDAYYISEPYKIFADVDGIDLAISVDEATKIIESENKNEYVFDLKITKAKKTINDLGTEAFPYLISSFSTKYDASNRNRSTNLEIAAKKINGKVLMPGEEFSFNKIVGKRTVEDGYKDAKIYADGGVVDGLAGGICQISSTLYNSVLLANLQITERRNHSFTTSYLPAGKDATVVWGTTDFKFINSRSYPIKIEAKVSNGIAEFKIHGMQEETEYEVKILPVRTQSIPFATTYEEDPTLLPGQQIVKQAGHAGCKVTTYKELRVNGAVVSKEAISTDTYNPMRKIIRVAPGGIPVQ